MRIKFIRRVYLPSFLGDVEFEKTLSRSNFEDRGGALEHWGGSWCGPSGAKLVYRNSESVQKFEFRMRFAGVYQMSED